MSGSQFNIGMSQQSIGKCVCRSCGRAHKLEPGDVGNFIQIGWPACCGSTMRLALGSDHRPWRDWSGTVTYLATA